MQVIDVTSVTAPLATFMRERHAIYLSRAAGKPRPWTDDPILQRWRFCNVFRELDTTTIWIRENIRERFADHPYLWFMLCIARYVNRIETLTWLQRTCWPLDPSFDPARLGEALVERARTGEPVYTGAYMIRAENNPRRPWYRWSKHRYVAEVVLGRLWEDRNDWCDFFSRKQALETTWRRFQSPRYVGWGPFMAYEVVTDLRHTRYLRDAPDIMTWGNAGPGALRGLNRLFERPLKASCPSPVGRMRALLSALREDATLWPRNYPGLELRDVEHSLCEFDKYERVRRGEGKPRSRYDGD